MALSALFTLYSLVVSVVAVVKLMPSGDLPVCYNNDSSTLTCMTTEGSLLWIASDSSRLINRLQDPVMLGNLTISVVSVVPNGTSLSVTSTATITNFRFFSSMSNSLIVQCREISTGITEQSTFIKADPPSPPRNVKISPIIGDINTTNSTLLISWSQSNCAVQYVVNNSDRDRIYTTSNTNITVTGVEFCVTVVAVGGLGNSEPDTPVCYPPVRTAAAATILPTSSNSVTPSRTVSHSPEMMGGINVAAAVVIPVVILVLLVLVIGVVVGLYLCLKNREYVPLPSKHKTVLVQVFSCEVDVNKWEIVCVVLDKHASLREITDSYKNDGYLTDGSMISVQVASDKDDVDITVQNVTHGWDVEQQQDNKPIEDITVKDGATFVVVSSHVTTTTFIVSSSETSPPDLSLSLIINGRKSVPFERKASRRCVCQVFCCREGLNCYRTTIAFFPERLLNEVKQIYKDVEEEPPVYFYMDDAIGVNCEGSTWPLENSEPAHQVSRAAVEGYTGEGEPPCIVMTLRADSSKTKPPDLSLPVTLTAVKEQRLQIDRPAEDPTGYVCQVFYCKKGLNSWTAILVFCTKSKVEDFLKNKKEEEIGPKIDIKFTSTSAFFLFAINPNIDNSTVTSGWKVILDSEHREVKKRDVLKYTGDGAPPSCTITIKPITDETPPSDLKECTVNLAGVDTPNKLQLTRGVEYSALSEEKRLLIHTEKSLDAMWPGTGSQAQHDTFPRKPDISDGTKHQYHVHLPSTQ